MKFRIARMQEELVSMLNMLGQMEFAIARVQEELYDMESELVNEE